MATAALSSSITTSYPIQLQVDPPAAQSRISVLLRLILAIPHLVVLYVLSAAMQVIWLISWFAILITGSYPAGLLQFSIGAWRWTMRGYAYMFLLTDRYPAFSLDHDEGYPVRLLVDQQVERRNRLTTFWVIRAILAVPHLIALWILIIVAAVVGFVAWIAALVTGSIPAGLHNFMAGVLRWDARAYGYLLNLVDEYPPFSLD